MSFWQLLFVPHYKSLAIAFEANFFFWENGRDLKRRTYRIVPVESGNSWDAVENWWNRMLERLTNHINVADNGWHSHLMRLSSVQTSQMSRLMLFLCLFSRTFSFRLHYVCNFPLLFLSLSPAISFTSRFFIW